MTKNIFYNCTSNRNKVREAGPEEGKVGLRPDFTDLEVLI